MLEDDCSERLSFGDIDSAVEYINSSQHENFGKNHMVL
jgi:hypothetical protein